MVPLLVKVFRNMNRAMIGSAVFSIACRANCCPETAKMYALDPSHKKRSDWPLFCCWLVRSKLSFAILL